MSGRTAEQERADVLALLRQTAAKETDEQWATWAEQLAEVIEDGAHEGMAEEAAA